MTIKKLLSVLFLCICILFYSISKSVAQKADSLASFYSQAIHQASAVYHLSFGDQIGLYNGPQYIEYPFKFTGGDPYLNSPAPEPGTVLYDGVEYDSMLMRYNEITDELVVNYYTDRIQLLKTKVESFRLFGSDFIKIEKDSSNSNLVAGGFFNLLYNGQASLLKKEIKTINERTSSSTEVENLVERREYYYLKRNGKYYVIKSKKAFLDLLSDRKSEIKQFIKANDLNYKRDRQNMLVRTTAYYDSLKK